MDNLSHLLIIRHKLNRHERNGKVSDMLTASRSCSSSATWITIHLVIITEAGTEMKKLASNMHWGIRKRQRWRAAGLKQAVFDAEQATTLLLIHNSTPSRGIACVLSE